MKLSTTAGLVGFLLALSSVEAGTASAALESGPGGDASLEARINRMTGSVRAREASTPIEFDGPTEVAAAVFLNSAPSFRNYVSGWRNTHYPYWVNSGAWNNAGIHFLNTAPSFRNTYSGWRNAGISGWPNGGSFRNGGFANGGGFHNGGFANGGGFRNGGFANGGGFRNGGGFYNR
jgi:cytoplasmic tRNA 2-thiolation protein 1